MTLKRIWQLLQPGERRKAWRMAVTVLFSALLDFVSLATLLPVLYILLDGEGYRPAALRFCLLAVSAILVKSVLITLFTRYQDRCLHAFYRRLSFSLFSAYYRRGLLFIREQGSNRLGYEINAVCYDFCHNLLASVCRMAADALLALLITAALLIYDWTTVLVLYASFLPFVCVYILVVRKRVRRYGEDDISAKREQSRVVTDTFRGYAELEVNGAFPVVQTAFLEGLDRISRNRIRLDTVLRLPLFLSELSAVTALALLAATGRGDVKMLVGVFAVAAFRLLPALRTLMAGWTRIEHAAGCLGTIEEGLRDPEEAAGADAVEVTFDKEITIDRLTYAYPGGPPVLEGLDCRIHKGEHVGFGGYSGAGKTTLFNLLIGLLEPTSGEIRIDGVPLDAGTRASWMKKIGYVAQDVFIFNGTLAENITLGGEGSDRSRIEEAIRQASLDRWVETLPDGLDTPLGETGGKLSGGQKQRIGIARALYRQAEVLLLDEAMSALDNGTEREVNETIRGLKERNKGLTVLSIAHRGGSLAYCERIIILGNENEQENEQKLSSGWPPLHGGG